MGIIWNNMLDNLLYVLAIISLLMPKVMIGGMGWDWMKYLIFKIKYTVHKSPPPGSLGGDEVND